MRRFIRRFNEPNTSKVKKPRDLFSSKIGIIAAAAGSAVGLGNIWRFPYETGQYGGAAFLILYLAFILLLGLPVMLSEFMVGRKARHNVVGTFKKLSPGKHWYVIGIMGIGAAFFISAFYSVVAGWSFEYIINAVTGQFEGKSPEQLNQMFLDFKNASLRPIIYQLIFLVLTGYIVASGVRKGIERYAKVLMPVLIILIIILDIRAVTLPGAGEGLKFLFKPDFSLINAEAVLSALGQAFFSLSLGMGALVTYGSYINKTDNLSSTAAEVTLADTLVAVLAGVAILPAVFAFGIEPSAGPGLVYITLPNVFEQMTGGQFFSILFFVLLLVAALTSSISILEVVVAYFVEELNLSRKNATIMAVALISVFGMLCSLSLNENAVAIHVFGMNFFELLEYIAANILLPLGGMLIAFYVGWILKKDQVYKELSNEHQVRVKFFGVFFFLVKYVAPFAILLVFLHGVGLLKLIVQGLGIWIN